MSADPFTVPLWLPRGDPAPDVLVMQDPPEDEGQAEDVAHPPLGTAGGPLGHSASVSGLRRQDRITARRLVVQAALLGLRNARAMHYSQSPRRWDGISKRMDARKGRFPTHTDCSGFATWCLWNGLVLPFDVRDVVNGGSWKYGNTDSMHRHGRAVKFLLRGDLVLYGRRGNQRSQHVAVYVGGGYVVSFGSERGPLKLRVKYRSDILATRRYI